MTDYKKYLQVRLTCDDDRYPWESFDGEFSSWQGLAKLIKDNGSEPVWSLYFSDPKGGLPMLLTNLNVDATDTIKEIYQWAGGTNQQWFDNLSWEQDVPLNTDDSSPLHTYCHHETIMCCWEWCIENKKKVPGQGAAESRQFAADAAEAITLMEKQVEQIAKSYDNDTGEWSIGCWDWEVVPVLMEAICKDDSLLKADHDNAAKLAAAIDKAQL